MEDFQKTEELETEQPTGDTVEKETSTDTDGSKLRKVFEAKLSEKDEELKRLKDEMETLRVNVEGRHVSNLYKEHGIEFDEQKEVLKEYQANTGKSLDEILSNSLIKKELSAIAGRKKAEGEQEQGGSGKQSLDYYIRTGKMPKDAETKRQLFEYHKEQEKKQRSGR